VQHHVGITSIAHYVPPDVLTNQDFEHLDTSDAWIRSRTGIVERRILKSGATSDLIVPAARECLERRGIGPEEIDCVIVVTITPDRTCPSTASIVQRKIGASRAWGFDLEAACCGFLFGLVTAASLVRSGTARRVLLCPGDKMSAITNYADRGTAVLFGDAGAAALVEAVSDAGAALQDHLFWMDGEGEPLLQIPAGGSACPASAGTVDGRQHTLRQDGQTIFRTAVAKMTELPAQLLARHGLSVTDCDWFVPHQANRRIIDAVAQRLGVPCGKVMMNVERFGNTSSTSIPLCLSEWQQRRLLRRGDALMLTAFGAGFTAAAVYLKWAM
jgi:3-oxoacyl-[acyl-carrier-protein] synthase-3